MAYITKQNDSFANADSKCSYAFTEAGPCWHLYTPENHEIILQNEADYRQCMSIMGVCSFLCKRVRIFTYELMSNHIHLAMSGNNEDVMAFFTLFKKALGRYLNAMDRTVNLSGFTCEIRRIKTLADMRNVIVYINRNGYLVSNNNTPFSYPWGANSYYFNPMAKELFRKSGKHMTLREIQSAIHSRSADCVKDLLSLDGYACPMSFCSIETGESFFRDARQYFYMLSRSMDAQREIASEIGDTIFYTDDELYSAIRAIAIKQYGSFNLPTLPVEAKIELAKVMRYQYHASTKAITRMLRLETATVESLFPGPGNNA